MPKRQWLIAACSVLGALSANCYAQAFPTKAVRIVVPFPPGATTDFLGRELAAQLQPRWGPVVVENKGGASGIIGSAQVARAVGDPHMLLVAASHHSINPSLQKSLPYDTKRDFTPLALLATGVNVLVVNSQFPAQNVRELIKLAKDKPGSINFASSGVGGANHLSGELFRLMAGIEMVHVPYKGAALAMSEVMAGNTPMIMFAGIASVVPQLPSGRVRALAVTSLRRVASHPDIPTIDEAGVKGYEVDSWTGLYGPAKLPPAAIARIVADVSAVLSSAEVKVRIAKHGLIEGSLSQPEFSRFVDDETAKWARVIERARIPKE